MNAELNDVAWPLDRLGEAIEALAHTCRLPLRRVKLPAPLPRGIDDPGDLGLRRWIEDTADWLGLEAEPVEVAYADVELLLARSSPALLLVQGEELRFLALAQASGRRVVLVDTKHLRRVVERGWVRDTLCRSLEEPLAKTLDHILIRAGVSARHMARTRKVVLRERLRSAQHRGAWLLRHAPDARLGAHAAQFLIPRRILLFFGTYVSHYSIWLFSWWIIGQGALDGRIDRGSLFAWALLLLTLIPIRALSTWTIGRVAVDAGAVIKQRLLAGSMMLDADEVRRKGTGKLLGQVIESDALEVLALGGGALGLVAAIELVISGFIIIAGAQMPALAFTLLGWIGVTATLAYIYYARCLRWTETRIEMTSDLVERIVGHRTRLAQERPESRHEEEDQRSAQYMGRSLALDRASVSLTTFVPRGWLVVGMSALAPAFTWGSHSLGHLAVAVGALLLVFRAFRTLTSGITDVVRASIAWKQSATLRKAAITHERAYPLALPPLKAEEGKDDPALLDCYSLTYRYPTKSEPALSACSVRIGLGHRLLLEGASGSGKSTLGALLAGLRTPTNGLILLNGLDRKTLGLVGWRRVVASVPQFHENHVFTGAFAFNLLMGRCWPPRQRDLKEAEDVCAELGLDGLLKRMPAGIMEIVGETGWQLSHGERSRLYIARALLQGSDLMVLDESFAALDPETLRMTLQCVLGRARSLVVIAHP